VSLFGKKDEGESAAPAAPPRTTTAPSPGPGSGRNQGDGVANIGKSITIKGDLSGNEDLVIEGKVEGKVELPNNQLTIGANGTVKAEVQAKSVIVVGKVAGNVRGTERIEIQATGVVDGDVSAPRLVVSEGAVLNGSIQMTQKGASATAPAPAPAPREAAQQVGAKAAS
jgi:cytoskeletal protein CcmA (bactofilin family)